MVRPSLGGVSSSVDLHRPLDQLTWDNRFTRSLPADPETTQRRRQVNGAAFSRIRPTPTAGARLLGWSAELAEQLGLSEEVVRSQDFADVFSGNRVPVGADPFAMAYAGHQFGNWAGQLGDGRAIALGEVLDRNGQHQTLQLKGAGPTPYSRGADGRAVLRSSLREFLCSEAMHHLGIPTTRALALVLTGDLVVRDVLYDGNPAPELGAVVCRVAPSFVRFGNFQLPASRGDGALLRELVEHTIRGDFPELAPGTGEDITAAHIGQWFDEVCGRSATLAVHWMRVGFVHGVLNTDNLSILGLTIDYGPYGWLEDFDPDWTPNTTDAGTRRYRYGQQPQIVHWNLLQLANALAGLLGDDIAPLQDALDRFGERYRSEFQAMLAGRLGWGAWGDGDDELAGLLFATLVRTETDQVIFYRDLARVPVGVDTTDDELLAPLADAWYAPAELVGEVREAWVTWLRRWAARVRDAGITDDGSRAAAMDARNPRFVLRNYLAQEAIDAIEQRGDASLLTELLDVLRRPYDEQPGQERFSAKRPDWARTRVGCSQLSCSS